MAYCVEKDVLYAKIKSILEKLIRYLERPLVITGKFAGSFFASYFKSKLFFFFPYYHIGGAEKVHVKITSCLKEYSPIVFFANKSKSSALKEQFMQSAKIFDIGYLNNPLLIYFWAGVLSTVVNYNKDCVVFGCNNILFYKLIPYLKPDICCIDLIHAFGGGIENVRICTQFSIKMNDRIFLIENCVQIPERIIRKNNESTLRILYVGRGSEEKRVHLIGKISRVCHQKNMPIEFVLVGDVKNSIPEQDRIYCNFLGEIVDEKKLSEVYASSDILLLVSSSEGFPLVIMEAMAYGLVTISTDVGGISEHVHDGYNGFLVKDDSEDLMIKNTCDIISELTSNKTLRDKISTEAYEYAKVNFNCKNFCMKYRKLIYGK